MGPSGCGKSTLLHLLGGLDRPDAGELSLAGVRVDGLSETQWAVFRRRTVGFVFQAFHLVDELTAVENVELPTLLVGVSRRDGAAPGDGAARAARCGRAGRPPPPPTVGRRAAARRGGQGPGQRAAGGARRRAHWQPGQPRHRRHPPAVWRAPPGAPDAADRDARRACGQHRRPAAHHAGRSNRGADAAGEAPRSPGSSRAWPTWGASADALAGAGGSPCRAQPAPPTGTGATAPAHPDDRDGRARRGDVALRERRRAVEPRMAGDQGLPRQLHRLPPSRRAGGPRPRGRAAPPRHPAHQRARRGRRPAAPGPTCTGRSRSTAAQRTSPPRCAIPALPGGPAARDQWRSGLATATGSCSRAGSRRPFTPAPGTR